MRRVGSPQRPLLPHELRQIRHPPGPDVALAKPRSVPAPQRPLLAHENRGVAAARGGAGVQLKSTVPAPAKPALAHELRHQQRPAGAAQLQRAMVAAPVLRVPVAAPAPPPTVRPMSDLRTARSANHPLAPPHAAPLRLGPATPAQPFWRGLGGQSDADALAGHYGEPPVPVTANSEVLKGTLLANLKTAVKNRDLRTLPSTRQDLDYLSQWMSDAVLRTRQGDVGPEALKQRGDQLAMVGRASALANRAFYQASLGRDEAGAKQSYGEALDILARIDTTDLERVTGAFPKRREVTVGYDSRAAALAVSLRDAGFMPNLVIGLPTGGAHAANRVAGALGALTGHTPEVNYLRPQGVKSAAKAIVEGADDPSVLRAPIRETMSEQLQRGLQGPSGTRILLVDDGGKSGGTMTLARHALVDALPTHFQIRTAMIEADNYQHQDEIGEPGKERPNPFDFVVNPHERIAGSRAGLKTLFTDHRDQLAKKPSALAETPDDAFKTALVGPSGDLVVRSYRIADAFRPATELE